MLLPHALKAVVFDMDGLLLDTEPLYDAAMVAAATEMGLILTPDIVHRTVGLPTPATRSSWMEHFGSNFDVEHFWSVAAAKFHLLADDQLCLKAGVLELLNVIDRLDLPRAIATSTGRSAVDRHLTKLGMANRFDAIVAHGDYADGKPHPAPYLMAADRLGIDPSNCLALEDSHNGVRSAAGAGMMAIMVPDILQPTDEMRSLCVAIKRNLHEVADLMQSG
jgi:beta-phosphoglucomutase-like phosphatase (HAD superfamily)